MAQRVCDQTHSSTVVAESAAGLQDPTELLLNSLKLHQQQCVCGAANTNTESPPFVQKKNKNTPLPPIKKNNNKTLLMIGFCFYLTEWIDLMVPLRVDLRPCCVVSGMVVRSDRVPEGDTNPPLECLFCTSWKDRVAAPQLQCCMKKSCTETKPQWSFRERNLSECHYKAQCVWHVACKHTTWQQVGHLSLCFIFLLILSTVYYGLMWHKKHMINTSILCQIYMSTFTLYWVELYACVSVPIEIEFDWLIDT